mgnify:CR=1 FL=1
MEYLNTAQELLNFIMRCKSPFHVVKEAGDLLNENGYTKLEETKEWSLVPGGKYYVTRNESSVIAFQIPESAFSSYQIIASHSDCPTFKVKGEDPFVTDGHYTRLNVEGYGGMIRSPWFDRPLSLAGRMVVRDGNSVKSVLVDAGRDLVTIPNLPIHLNRDINNGIKYSVQTDMLPILGDETAKDHFYELFLPDTAKEDILSMELYLYNRVEGSIWGAGKEFLSSGRLDDLQSAFGSLKGFLAAKATGQVNVCAIFDNEEVGSLTKQGADSSFLTETLQHINAACGKDTIAYHRDLAGSFLVSADNAHAFHPAHAEKYESEEPRIHERRRSHQTECKPEIHDRCCFGSRNKDDLREGRRTVPGIRKPRRHSGRKHAWRNSELSCLGDKRGYRNGSACDAFPV